MNHYFTKDILLVNNAFSKSKELIECVTHINQYEKSYISNNANSYISNLRTSKEFTLDGSKYPSLNKFIEDLTFSINKCYEIYKSYNQYVYGSIQYQYGLLKYDSSDYFREHVDLIPGNIIFQKRQLSVLVYLSSDYEGGETRFNRQEIQIKPPAGSIALFPPFYTHPHSCEPILSGTKFVVVNWLLC